MIDADAFVMPENFGVYECPIQKGNTTCIGMGDVKKGGSHLKMKSFPSLKACAGKRAVGGYHTGWTVVMCHVARKCACNVHNALHERHGSDNPAPTRDINDHIGVFLKLMDQAVVPYATNTYLDFAVWLARWPPGKQRAIIRSIENDMVKANGVKAMVKRELYAKRPSKARLIQFYRNLATQALFGPEFLAAQKSITAVFERADLGNGIDATFGSGKNAKAIAAWATECEDRGATCYYERDGKNWDSTMGPNCAKFRQTLYGVLDNRLADFSRECDNVTGFAVLPEGLVRYTMKYTVKSGHNDTTLGNTLLNIAIAYAAMVENGVRGSIIATGDDLLVAIYGKYNGAERRTLCEQMKRTERAYGIVPEAGVLDSLYKTSFVSGIFVNDSTNKIGFIPTPGRQFARLWWTVNNPGAGATHKAYVRGVARGMMPTCADLPVMRQFVGKFDSAGVARRSDKGYLYRECDQHFDNGIWAHFAERYGVSIEELRACDDYLSTLPAVPLFIKHPVLDRMCVVDGWSVEQRAGDEAESV